MKVASASSRVSAKILSLFQVVSGDSGLETMETTLDVAWTSVWSEGRATTARTDEAWSNVPQEGLQRAS